MYIRANNLDENTQHLSSHFTVLGLKKPSSMFHFRCGSNPVLSSSSSCLLAPAAPIQECGHGQAGSEAHEDPRGGRFHAGQV